jgi:hypothetical protein
VTKFPNLSAAAAASLKVFGVIVYVLTKSWPNNVLQEGGRKCINNRKK